MASMTNALRLLRPAPSIAEALQEVRKPQEMLDAEAQCEVLDARQRELNAELSALLNEADSPFAVATDPDVRTRRMAALNAALRPVAAELVQMHRTIDQNRPIYSAAVVEALRPFRREIAGRIGSAIADLNAAFGEMTETVKVIEAAGGRATRLPPAVYLDAIFTIAGTIAKTGA